MELFSKGQLAPLPHRIFAGEYTSDAFRFMQRSAHIGKIVITPATRPTEAPRSIGRFPVSTEGLHVVIGGTSGFGLATAEWLVERGARHLALVSRTASLSDEAKAEVDKLRDAGAKITVAAVDVTDLGALQRFFQKMQASIPINGIVHAAMVLEDRLIEGLDQESIEKVLQPKVQGALNLERLCRDLPLDYLLLYSSATTLLGNPGQFNYVAANAYMEGVAQRARADGLPALAVAWGGIEDVGYLAKNINASASLKKRFATSLVTARVALDALDLAFDAEGRPKTAFLSIAQIDWAMARRELAATRAPKFAAVIPGAGARQTTDAAATLEKLRTMSLEDASAAMLEIVVDEIARVLRLLPKEVDRHRPLADIGMDSLMMLELRATVETALQIQLPMMSLANGITPSDIARRVAGLIIGGSQQETVPGHLMALSTSHMASDTEATDSDEQLAAARAILERSRTIEGPL